MTSSTDKQIGWLRADWPSPPGVTAGCTIRAGGVSQDACASLNLAAHVGDDAAHVIENRQRFLQQCALPADPLWLTQVHGTDVVTDPTAGQPQEADAMITARPGVVCAVLTADCLPVLFAARDGSEIAAAHAGWRGLCAGVLEKTLVALSTPVTDMLVWLGPAISQPAFEVGEEVRAAFLRHDAAAADCFVENQRGRWQADLVGLAHRRLTSVGVRQIFGGDFCTYAEADRFFSYRREAGCGRMASFIFRS